MKFLISALSILSSLLIFSTPVNAASGIDRGPLSKITFIHYRPGRSPLPPLTPVAELVKPSSPAKPRSTSCYAFISSGARWKTTENFTINPTNIYGLGPSFVENSFSVSAETWDQEVPFDIFGATSTDSAATFSFDSTDGNNVVLFDTYSDPGVIAVTNVWGYFYGSPKTRELVEWDMLMNEYFLWGNVDTMGTSVMDLVNIAIHELGHSAGLADLYNTACQEETMYGYSTEGETKKRDLNSGDVAGIKKLYN